MSNHKIVFLSRVVVTLPGISLKKWKLLKWDTVNISCWHGNYTQLHATTRETPHENILNMAATIFDHVFLRF